MWADNISGECIIISDRWKVCTCLQVEMPEGSTVAQLAQHLGLPRRDIKIVMVNGRQHQVDDPMRDGDRIAYFPAVGGG